MLDEKKVSSSTSTSTASIDATRDRWRRRGGSSNRRNRARARSTSSNLTVDDNDEDTTTTSDDDENIDASLDAAARFLHRAWASGREYARDVVSDVIRPVFPSDSTSDVETWARAGFDALERFASRASASSTSARLPRVVGDVVLDAADASRLAQWDDETSAKARARVVSWLDDRREFDDALVELDALREFDDGEFASVRLIQRRELVARAVESWRDFRDVVVAVQLGAEECRHVERTIRLARRASRARDDVEGEDDASDARWRRAFGACALAYATRAPTAVETREKARACVVRVRAVNACDVSVGGTGTGTGTATGTGRRVVDAAYAYADRDVDVTALLADAANDLRDAKDAVVRETRARGGESGRAGEREVDRDRAGRATIQPLVARYESSALGGIVDRVIRAVEIEEEGELLARCALFVGCVAEPLRAHVAATEAEALEAAVRAFEEEDARETAAARSATVTTTRKKKGKRRASSRSGTEPPPKTPPPNRPIESPATSDDDDDDDAREEDDRCDARADARASIDADESLVGWTTARARRKPNAAASAKTRARSPPPRPVAVGVSARPRPLPRVAPTPSLGLSARPGFPPKPKPVASRRVEVESSKTPKTPKTPPKTPPLRSVGEYRRMLNTESERERESRLRDFPELKTRSSPAVNTAEVRRAPSRVPPPRAFATPANAKTPPPPPPPRKTWAEAKRAIDGVKLPSLIKIK